MSGKGGWYCLAVTGGDDYAASEFQASHNRAAMIDYIRKHYSVGPYKKQKLDEQEEEEEEEEKEEEEEEQEDGDYTIEVRRFGPIDPAFVGFVYRFQDYDDSKHSNYWMFPAHEIE